MTAQVYRFYSGNVVRDMDYVFSIVANEKEARYVIAESRINQLNVFDQERIREITLSTPTEELPTTSDDWARLAAYNIDRLSLHPIEGNTAESIDDLIEDEQEYADATAEKYGEDYI